MPSKMSGEWLVAWLLLAYGLPCCAAIGAESSSREANMPFDLLVTNKWDSTATFPVTRDIGPCPRPRVEAANDPAFADDASRGHTVAHGVGAKVANQEATNRPLVGTWRPGPLLRGVREQSRGQRELLSSVRIFPSV
jgi:hypothetical protein